LKSTPTITLYSDSYVENALISPAYYSTSCYQGNYSPNMEWILNNFNGLTVTSFEILCEDLNAFGTSPNGKFVHWWVTNIDPTQLGIILSGSWIGTPNILPTDYGSGDDPNGWNGPCPLAIHNYRMQITANLLIGGPIVSNYSIFRASCIAPFC
jgi:phosphatidylethanolamine-binding protein (PEBP) family uncharacterized protein